MKSKIKISIFYIMGIFDDLFPEYELSDEDDDYDPYDTTGKYGQYGICNRGINKSSTGWCCMECERDRMRRRKQYNKLKEEWIKNPTTYFNCNYDLNTKNFFDSDKCFNDFKYVFINEEPILQIDNDWKVLNLIPPKTKQEIKKSYRKLCLTHHPDKGGKAVDFVRITDSYNNLMCIVS